MKANLNETMTTPLTSLHRKSTAAIHRGGASSRQQGASGGGVGRSRLSELAAAVASPNASEEMQLYFSKLKELVPFMPRNRKLSKLEIIQYVIDYICDLQLALETQPKSNAVAVAASLAAASAASSAAAASPPQQLRQPLGVIASNNTSNGTCAVQEASFSHSLPLHGHSLPLHDKSPLCGVDSTVSC